MAPKIEPIMLWGFCFNTQQAKIQFNQSWVCAFHTSWYTDERHPMWDSIDDGKKRREIRYGNNIAVLFRALIHCKAFYGQDSMWSAIARGFNTNASTVRNTAEALTQARRAQRSKPARDVPDTASAADNWIEFLDSQETHPRVLSDPKVYEVAEAFFHTQEKKLVNAARVPTDPRQALHLNMARFSPRGPAEETRRTPPQFPPSPSIKLEGSTDLADRQRLLQQTRKRSASPPASEREMKSRRFSYEVREHPRTEPERQGERDGPPRIQPTTSPRRSSYPRPIQVAQSMQPPPSAPSGPAAQSAQSFAPRPPPKGRQEASMTSHPAFFDDRSALQGRIAGLEKQLAEAKSKLGIAPASAPAPAAPNQVGKDMEGLKRDMATVTNVIGTMMESMHDIVDSLNSLQDEVSGLSTQQKELAISLPQTGNLNLDGVLRPIQTITENVNLLRSEVSELKKQSATTAPTVNGAQQSPTTAESTAKLETLLQQQNVRIDRLVKEMSGMQAQLVTALPRSQLSQQQTPPPQTLRQTMAAAERDLKHHLEAVQKFYHQLDGGTSREVTERTADLLAALSGGLQMAQLGLGHMG